MNNNYADMAQAPMPQETQQADPAKTDQLREDIIRALEQQGVMEKLQSEQEMNEILQLVDQLVEAMINGDQAAMQENPLLPLIAGQPAEMAGPEAAPPQGEM